MRADKSLKPFEIRLYRHYRIVHGVRIALAFVLTFIGIKMLIVEWYHIPVAVSLAVVFSALLLSVLVSWLHMRRLHS